MAKCIECFYFEEVFAGTGRCKRGGYIIYPQLDRDCDVFVPKDVMREDFLERVFASRKAKLRRGAEKEEGGLLNKLRRLLKG